MHCTKVLHDVLSVFDESVAWHSMNVLYEDVGGVSLRWCMLGTVYGVSLWKCVIFHYIIKDR